MSTYEEWRVTGTPKHPALEPVEQEYRGEGSEEAARFYASAAAKVCDWADGPHLHRRTVTVTEWEEAT